jgi:Spy/CpxP family protein refolding chaperone
MITRKTGFVTGAALAAGLAIGLAGTALAANPSASPGYPSMMGGRGMMGGASLEPGSSYGPGMMGGLTQDQRQQMLDRCEQILGGNEGSPSPSATSTPR